MYISVLQVPIPAGEGSGGGEEKEGTDETKSGKDGFLSVMYRYTSVLDIYIYKMIHFVIVIISLKKQTYFKTL